MEHPSLLPMPLPFRAAALLVALAAGASAAAQPTTDVPVERVILFTSGVGYFEHAGRVSGDAEVVLRFDETALNDVLKSLLVEDPGGRVAGVLYPSQAPIERTLRSFALDLSGAPDLANILTQARGAEVTVDAPGGSVRGTILAVGTAPPEGVGMPPGRTLTLATGGGLVTLRLEDVRRIAFTDAAMQAELDAALAALAEARGGQRRPVRIQLRGGAGRRVRLGYVVEAPVWKTSYRLVLPEQGAADGTLQGWALVENPTEADWSGVDLTLVSGRPVSFVTDLYTPRYIDRPVVTLADDAVVRPETYAEGARSGSGSASVRRGGPGGTITGRVVDRRSGEEIIGATVQIVGTNRGASTNVDGQFEIGGLSATTYSIRVTFVGYDPVETTVTVGSRQGEGAVVEARLGEGLASFGEAVVSSAAPPPPPASAPVIARGGRADGAEYYANGVQLQGGVIDPNSGFQAQATTGDFGELFAYRLRDVTLPRRASAMLPIVAEGVSAERLSVFTGNAGRHPMRGVRLRNTTGASLRGGPMTVLDDGYAGDALLPDLQPGTDRLLTFAVDQDVLVDPFPIPNAPGRIETATLRDGILVLRRQALTQGGYRLENRGERARTVLVERRRQADARLEAPAAAEESTPDLYRFRVALAPGAVDTLVVREAQTLSEQVALFNESPDRLAVLARADGNLPENVRQALERAVTERRALAETERQLQALQQEVDEIERDQERVRGNLEAVDNNTDYARRLLRRLDDQETRLEAIGRERESLEARAAEQRQALRVSVP